MEILYHLMSLFSKKVPLSPEDGAVADSTRASTHTEHPLMEIIRFSLIALLIVIPIRMFIAQPFIVSGASMEETFQSGEYLIVDQASYYFHDPKRGDIVIFRYPRDPSKFFIKRVIGIPGDTITITDNVVRISNDESPEGFTLDESYIKSMNKGTTLTEVLKSGEYFVMGDNRDQSSDSRTWGILEEDKIVGRAFLRLFPPQSFDYLPGSLEDVSITKNQ